MTQEEKDLLLKDICVRLPYGVKVSTTDNDGSLENVWDTLWYNTFTEDVNLIHSIENADKIVDISEIKPYLFPPSSMTEEQYRSLDESGILSNCIHSYEYFNHHIHSKSFIFKGFKTYSSELIDWLNKNHFDYRGLIEKGLAIDATGLNIY